MADPLLEIKARFNINEEPGLPLDGRAYLSGFNFEKAYNSDIIYAARTLRGIVQSPELKAARERDFNHTIALMWGSIPVNDGFSYQMIDFIFWDYDNWGENGEMCSALVENGKINKPHDGISPVTCEGGWKIANQEVEARHSTTEDVFKRIGPEVSGMTPDAYDFCRPGQRPSLREFLGK